MFEDKEPDTIPGNEASSELLEAVEWLKSQGYLSGEQRPFESLLQDK